MPTYPVQAADSKGVALVFNTSANGDRVPPGCLLIVKNTSGAGATVTMVTPAVFDNDLALADRTSNSIPATTGINAIRVPANSLYIDPADGLVQLNFSAPGATLAYAVVA